MIAETSLKAYRAIKPFLNGKRARKRADRARLSCGSRHEKRRRYGAQRGNFKSRREDSVMPDIDFIITSFTIGVILFELINYFKFRP